MRTLKEISSAVRRHEYASTDELRYALVAYDVLIYQLDIAQDEQQLAEFFKAFETCPKEYVGWENDPENPEAVKWHTEHINNRPEVFERGLEMLGDYPLTVVTPGSIASVQIEGRLVPDDIDVTVFEDLTTDGDGADPEARALMSLDWSTPDGEKTVSASIVRHGPDVVTVHKTAAVGPSTTFDVCTTCMRPYRHSDGECPHCEVTPL